MSNETQDPFVATRELPEPVADNRTQREIDLANAEPTGSIRITLTGSMAALTPGTDDDVAEFFVKEGVGVGSAVQAATAFIRTLETEVNRAAEAAYAKAAAADVKAREEANA